MKATTIDRPLAVTWGPLTICVVTPVPLIATVVAPGTRLTPVSVTFTVVPGAPEDGLSAVNTGAGGTMVMPGTPHLSES
jgi:hypothetical protein